MKIYLASNWNSVYHEHLLLHLHDHGFTDVYDFRNPAPDTPGFSWSRVDPKWERWSFHTFATMLDHPMAARAFASDMTALAQCDVCILVQPAKDNALVEFGIAIGHNKRTIIFAMGDSHDTDSYKKALMFRAADTIAYSIDEVIGQLRLIRDGASVRDAIERSS